MNLSKNVRNYTPHYLYILFLNFHLLNSKTQMEKGALLGLLYKKMKIQLWETFNKKIKKNKYVYKKYNLVS